ncbi:MAG: hypothetical protein V1887_00995 [Candidatus Aenigmatarchaeota archaeon]
MKGQAERPTMTVFWTLFALASVAVFVILVMFIFDKLVGVSIT